MLTNPKWQGDVVLNLDNRKAEVLTIVIEKYIQTAEPVGSKYIAIEMGSVSSATIRNDLSTLENMGLLEQPHASAGRIPTSLGFRVYVDSIMCPRPLSLEQKRTIDALFNVRNVDPDQILNSASCAVSALTGLGAFSTTILKSTVTVRKIAITPIDENTLIITLASSNGVIKNKVCRVDFLITTQIVDFFSKFANSKMYGQSLEQITQLYLNSVSVDLGDYSMVFNPVFAAIYELVKEVNDGQYFLHGTTKLLKYSEIECHAYELLSFLEHSDHMIELLGDGEIVTWAIIGKESQVSELSKCSILSSRYKIGKHSTGLIGVVGPIRLDYATVMPQLDYFADTLGKLLTYTYNEKHD